ncbi:MAG: protein translocase subunit SecD [Hyphomicrobiales bacterium]|nr:protein translocase subunit SecD [Hyphomicrobiales bacterium]
MLYFTKWKIVFVLAVCAAGLLFALPNAFPQRILDTLPDWLPRDKVVLGLDLQGGSHLLLEVDVDTAVRERLETLVDDARSGLRGERIGYRNLGVRGDALRVEIIEEEEEEEEESEEGGENGESVESAEDEEQVVEVVEAVEEEEIDMVAAALDVLGELSEPIAATVFTPVPVEELEITANGNVVEARLSEQARLQRTTSAVSQSIEIIRRRIDELGTREPTIQRQGERRILVQAPGLDDPERLKELLGQTAKLSFHLVDSSMTPERAEEGRPPTGSELLYSDTEPKIPYLIRKRIMVSGENLVDAQPAFEQISNRPVVNFRFDNTGARRFGKATQENVGQPFAIVLDGEVISAPVIREPILGGSGQISGNFTVESANDLSILLRAGALPAPLEIIEERTVGPGLGADSIRAGAIACVIGLAAVLMFMFFAYGRFGMFADVALLVNLILLLGALSLLGATLTLPGIAGIVLTIGMAVDANVLIFERIDEETSTNKSPLNAVDAGYRRALGTILDANITTLIAALVLFQVGSGPVRGFAVTLAIGIITSVFTAFILTRMLMVLWLRGVRPKTLRIRRVRLGAQIEEGA